MPNANLTASPEAERYLLGVLLRDSLPLPQTLIPSDFIEPKHQDIASAIRQLEGEQISADELTLTLRLRENKSPVEPFYISELTTTVRDSSLNPQWAADIARLSTLRSIERTARKTADLAADPASQPDALLAFIEGSFKSLSGRTSDSSAKGPERMQADALLAFDPKEDPNNVLGNRWLCKGGSALWISQSGVGKSSLCMQAAVHWSVGKDFFGIKAKRPLRIAIVQAENDFGDTAEAFQGSVKGAWLHPNEQRLLSENLAIFRDTTSVGFEFPSMLRQIITSHAADLIFVDPLLAFAGIDIADQQAASQFCRHDLNDILKETGCVLIAMHHTTKPRTAKDKEGQTVADMAYSGSGSAEFVNYFREVGVLVRQQGDEPVFKFGFTKRRGRSGMKNSLGDFAGEITIRHSKDKGLIRWEYASEFECPAETAAESPRNAQPRR